MLPRHLAASVERSLRHFPVVMVMGARQVGKSTLVESLARAKKARVLTLDDRATLDAATVDPDGLLAGLSGPVVLDEVQRAPGLLRALKPVVDRDRRPGRFLITGSAHLSTMATVSETLAGRVAVHELGPFTWSELARRRQPTAIEAAFRARSAREFLAQVPVRVPPERRAELSARILAGGYPQPARLKDVAARRTWFESYRRTYLERDIRDLASVHAVPELNRLLTLVALRTGQMFNVSELARDAGLSNTTARRYLDLLQQTFQVILLRPWFANVGKRLVKTPKVYFTDTGMACHLAAADDWATLERQLRVGPMLETFVANELHRLIGLDGAHTQLSFFRVEHGREVDFVLERGGELVGVEVKWSTGFDRDDLQPLQTLRDATRARFRLGILLHTGSEALEVSDRLVAMPVASFLGRDVP